MLKQAVTRTVGLIRSSGARRYIVVKLEIAYAKIVDESIHNFVHVIHDNRIPEIE